MSFGRKGLAPGEEAIAAIAPAGIGQTAQAPRQASANIRKFDVTPKPLLMIACIVFFGAVSAFLLYEVFDPRGVVINGFITLGPVGADIFFGLLFLASAGAVVIGVSGLLSSLRGKSYLTLDGQAIEGLSGPLMRKQARIQYALIEDVKLSEYQGKHMVKIIGRNGDTIRTGSQDFRSDAEFGEFLDLLNERLAATRL